jgi:hypothetical protein
MRWIVAAAAAAAAETSERFRFGCNKQDRQLLYTYNKENAFQLNFDFIAKRFLYHLLDARETKSERGHTIFNV